MVTIQTIPKPAPEPISPVLIHVLEEEKDSGKLIVIKDSPNQEIIFNSFNSFLLIRKNNMIIFQS
jgi:hypothetical protein